MNDNEEFLPILEIPEDVREMCEKEGMTIINNGNKLVIADWVTPDWQDFDEFQKESFQNHFNLATLEQAAEFWEDIWYALEDKGSIQAKFVVKPRPRFKVV